MRAHRAPCVPRPKREVAHGGGHLRTTLQPVVRVRARRVSPMRRLHGRLGCRPIRERGGGRGARLVRVRVRVTARIRVMVRVRVRKKRSPKGTPKGPLGAPPPTRACCSLRLSDESKSATTCRGCRCFGGGTLPRRGALGKSSLGLAFFCLCVAGGSTASASLSRGVQSPLQPFSLSHLDNSPSPRSARSMSAAGSPSG